MKLHETAALLYGMDLEERLHGVMALTASRTAFASLSDNLQQLFKIAGPRPLLPRSSAIAIERTCIRQVLQVLASAETLDTIEGSNPERLRLVRQAEEFMLANLYQPLLTEDICTEIAVSERILRYACQDRFGLSPMAYYKTRKLNPVRQVLKQADPCETTVLEIAVRWGFLHTGNFAADYRRLFGELPSETLST